MTKKIAEFRVLNCDDQVVILAGPNTPKVEVVRTIGRVGFLVKERSVVYFWIEEGVTWRPV